MLNSTSLSYMRLAIARRSSLVTKKRVARSKTGVLSGSGERWSSYVGDVRCRRGGEAAAASAGGTATGIGARKTGIVAVTAHANTYQHHHHNKKSRRAFASSSEREEEHERLLVIGSGVAGCSAALVAASHGIRSTVLHAGSTRDDCNSYWAQGGIIYKNYGLRREGGDDPVDTALSLVNDVRAASGYVGPLKRSSDLDEGPYLREHVLDGENTNEDRRCSSSGVNWNEDAAWKLALEGPGRVRQLLLGSRDGGTDDFGADVPFDRAGEVDGDDAGEMSLCLEASHAAPRIIHQADCTGMAITTHITAAAANHPLIDFVSDAVVTDLLLDDGVGAGSDVGPLVIGARVLDRRTGRETETYASRGVVLASGGLAGVYEHSTNPAGFNALGSSVALALRASGAVGEGGRGVCADLEYVQFHPTSLFIPNESRFLLTEALRGEGAILRDADGRAFASEYHPDAELAPRDVVARAVFHETQKSNDDDRHNAYLDITHRDSSWLRKRFPTVDSHLRSRGLDFTSESVPVVPAAHYTCGGVTTDLDGRVPGYSGLYAAGEAARTGLHGGNRLASTSLLEGLVYGASAADCAAGKVPLSASGGDEGGADAANMAADRARSAIEGRLARQLGKKGGDVGRDDGGCGDESVRLASTTVLARLKSIMWDGVGVVRTSSGLAAAASELAAVQDEAELLRARAPGCWEASALRDAASAGLAVAESALANRVSGGAHYVVSDEVISVAATAPTDRDVENTSDEDGSDDEDNDAVAARG